MFSILIAMVVPWVENAANLTKLSTLNMGHKHQWQLDTAILMNGEEVISQRKAAAEEDKAVVGDEVATCPHPWPGEPAPPFPALAPSLPGVGHYKEHTTDILEHKTFERLGWFLCSKFLHVP